MPGEESGKPTARKPKPPRARRSARPCCACSGTPGNRAWRRKPCWKRGSATWSSCWPGKPPCARMPMARLAIDQLLGRGDRCGGQRPGGALGGGWKAGMPGCRAPPTGCWTISCTRRRGPLTARCYHVSDKPQVWVDSLFMAPPFLARAGQPKEAVKQIEGMRRRLWQPGKKMFAAVWDEGRKPLSARTAGEWATAGRRPA